MENSENMGPWKWLGRILVVLGIMTWLEVFSKFNDHYLKILPEYLFKFSILGGIGLLFFLGIMVVKEYNTWELEGWTNKKSNIPIDTLKHAFYMIISGGGVLTAFGAIELYNACETASDFQLFRNFTLFMAVVYPTLAIFTWFFFEKWAPKLNDRWVKRFEIESKKAFLSLKRLLKNNGIKFESTSQSKKKLRPFSGDFDLKNVDIYIEVEESDEYSLITIKNSVDEKEKGEKIRKKIDDVLVG